MIYFIEEAGGGSIKIGRTRSRRTLARRIRSLQTGNPRQLRLLRAFPENYQINEALMHTKLKDAAVFGEWFRREPALELMWDIEAFEAVMLDEWLEIEMKSLSERRTGGSYAVHV